MNFKPQFFLMKNKMKKHDKHKLKAYFLRNTDIIIGLIFKMMKNQMIKQQTVKKEEIKFGDLPRTPSEDDLTSMPSLEDDEEELKEAKGLKIFTSSKLLTGLPVLLAQIKAGNSSYKLQEENQNNTISFLTA